MKRVALILILISAFSLAASAETIRGVVRNGTTNKPSAGDEVVLKKIASGMEEVAKTKTNSKGEFSFSVPSSQQPYLVWVKHQEVTYTKVATPGGGPAAVVVFDASADVPNITVQEQMMVMQTDPPGTTLKVDSLVTLNNTSSPPRTKNGQHTFEFYLPENARVEEATAQTLGSMALKTPVVPAGEPNKYFFGYPLRPGQTQFRLSYSLPYSGKLSFSPKLTMPVDHILLVTPSSINLTPEDASVFTPKTDPQIPKNVSLFVGANLQPGARLGFQIQGTGELPREEAAGGGGGGQGGSQGEDTRPGGGLGVPNERPNPLQNGQWLFLGVLTIFLAAGAVYVYTAKPLQAAATAAAKPPKVSGGKDRSSSFGSSMLMEAMKEELFQLESDRLQGRITQQEYEASKAALDTTLQRAVKRQASAR